ncbi:hypothetical protein [Paenarthrobacter sp. TA1.8]|uniref:hypothetical protein n=1 Tax=Paenarthrobacter sp. TA1.8 TaxID=3400219 RepID=UPI003B433058
MTNKMGKTGKAAKLPGENVVSVGLAFCCISAVIYLITAFNGLGNGLILFGGGVLGLLMIAVGYLKRIAAALTSR